MDQSTYQLYVYIGLAVVTGFILYLGIMAFYFRSKRHRRLREKEAAAEKKIESVERTVDVVKARLKELQEESVEKAQSKRMKGIVQTAKEQLRAVENKQTETQYNIAISDLPELLINSSATILNSLVGYPHFSDYAKLYRRLNVLNKFYSLKHEDLSEQFAETMLTIKKLQESTSDKSKSMELQALEEEYIRALRDQIFSQDKDKKAAF